MSDRPAATPPSIRAVSLYLLCVVLMAAVSETGWRVALVAELLLVAWFARRERITGLSSRVLALAGLARFTVGGTVALFAHPISAAFNGLTPGDLVSLARPRMVLAAADILWSLTPLGVLFCVLFAVTAMPAMRQRGRGGWPAFVAVGVTIPLMAAFDPVHTRAPRTFDAERLGKMVGLGPFQLDPQQLSARVRPEVLPSEGVTPDVTFILLESVGALNILEHLERHPDGAFARIVARGMYFERVLSLSNASHMAQPALLTSQEYSPGIIIRNARVPVPPPKGWGFAEHFRAKGWLTRMLSSQDETWLGMNAITLSPAWQFVRHAHDATDVEKTTYVDACGTRKVFDSVTFQMHVESVKDEPRPLFTYLNLQNSHFPYIVEADGEDAADTELECKDQHFGPAWKLMLARRQYERALDESLERVVALIEANPDTLFVLTGDHGESMLPGESFGHAHRAIPEQMETFGLFVGPGVEPLRETRSISSLDLLPTTIAIVSPQDLEVLPRDMLQGIDARTYGDRRRVQLSVSYGMQPTSYAVDVDGVWMQLTAEEIHCQDRAGEALDVARCEVNREALAYWLSCKTAFYAQEDHSRWYEPCWRLTREKFSAVDIATID